VFPADVVLERDVKHKHVPFRFYHHHDIG